MTQIFESRKALVGRLEVVAAYLATGLKPDSFAYLFNAGFVRPDILEKIGPVNPEDLYRWEDACVEAMKEEEDD
jgi:hypothetical protein